MAERRLTDSTGYCGLVCTVCSHIGEGCAGCRSGGGDEACHQRQCCVAKGLEGCWECESMPCDAGYFADEAWAGLCIGFCQAIKDLGIEAVVRMAESSLGETVEYGGYRFKDAAEIRATLRGESAAEPPRRAVPGEAGGGGD